MLDYNIEEFEIATAKGFPFYRFVDLPKEAVVDETVEVGQIVFRAEDLRNTSKITKGMEYRVIQKYPDYCVISDGDDELRRSVFYDSLVKKVKTQREINREVRVEKKKIALEKKQLREQKKKEKELKLKSKAKKGKAKNGRTKISKNSKRK